MILVQLDGDRPDGGGNLIQDVNIVKRMPDGTRTYGKSFKGYRHMMPLVRAVGEAVEDSISRQRELPRAIIYLENSDQSIKRRVEIVPGDGWEARDDLAYHAHGFKSARGAAEAAVVHFNLLCQVRIG